MSKFAALLVVAAMFMPVLAQAPSDPGNPPSKKKVVKKKIVLLPGQPPPPAEP